MTNARACPGLAQGGDAPLAQRHTGPWADAEQRCSKIAQAAATGLMTHKDVEDALVRIDGPRRAPRLWIECFLSPHADVTRTTEVVVGVREQLEAMLDITFDTVEMTIRNIAIPG
ncbi:MAG: hypothetical protein MOP51_3262 [Citricoccus sp.]|nr:hypothetical protein [Citricoccus sp. WCRC_4]